MWDFYPVSQKFLVELERRLAMFGASFLRFTRPRPLRARPQPLLSIPLDQQLKLAWLPLKPILCWLLRALPRLLQQALERCRWAGRLLRKLT